ncbi:MAG TPA: peptidyl-prolyl cis-trans isomerase [bacterium]|nr:peptidyl-prolyl cis-trans isomerase [bacterium]
MEVSVRFTTVFILAVLGLSACHTPPPLEIPSGSKGPIVVLNTSHGDIYIELFPEKAPIAVSHFMEYVKSGFYNNTVFHRVIDGWLIQGGEFSVNLKRKATNTELVQEADNGLSHKRGTIAFAWTPVMERKTAQFFINLSDNDQFDYREEQPMGTSHTVFGRVIKGLNVIDLIGATAQEDIDRTGGLSEKSAVIRKAQVLFDTW